MKILYIHHGEIMGGAPVSLLNMILGLQEIADVDIMVLCVNYVMKKFFYEHAQVKVKKFFYPCKIFGKMLIWGDIFHVSKFKKMVQEIFQLPLSIRRQYYQFKAEQPDIIHLNSSILFTTAVAARFAKIPIVWHVREVLSGSGFNLRKILAGWFIRTFADKVIAISPAVAKSLGNDSTGKVEVIYNFVDFSRFNPERFDRIKEKEKFGITPNEKLVVSLGGVAFRKGTVQLIEAMQYVNKHVRLIIAGPPLCNHNYSKHQEKFLKVKLQIEELLIKVGIKRVYNWEYQYRTQQMLSNTGKDNIIFTGILEDIVPLIAACDVLVFAGTTPHFPRPVFEAWVMKKPVIAFNMLGISEHIDDGINGIVVKEMTGKALGEAIQSVIDNDILLQKMGEQGYKKAYTYFRKEVNIPKIWNIYKELCHDE